MRTLSFAEFEKAMESGFQEKALSILRANERYFTKREMRKVYEHGKTNAAVLKYLMELSIDRDTIDVSENDNEPIRKASEHSHKEVVRLLLACDGVDPSAHDNEAIQKASENGHKEVVRLLLACGGDSRVDPSANDNEAIRWASKNGHLEVVRLLSACGGDSRVDPSAGDNEAILWAYKNGHLEIVKILMADRRVQAKGVPRYILKKYKRL